MLRKRGGNASKSVNNARASGFAANTSMRLPKTRAGTSVMLSTSSRRPRADLLRREGAWAGAARFGERE